MDDEQLAVLIQGLSAAMGQSMEPALDNTFGDEAVERHEERLKEKAYTEAKTYVLQSVISSWKKGQEKRAQDATGIISRYCARTHQAIYVALKNDNRMPKTINYLERYSAFRKMDSRENLFKRIEQTINAAERAITHEVDAASAVRDAAASYYEAISELRDITVAQCEPDEAADATVTEVERAVLHRREVSKDSFASIEQVISDTFRETMSEDGEEVVAPLSEDSLEKRMEREIGDALIKANAAARHAARLNAMNISGAVLSLEGIEPFDGNIKYEVKIDAASLGTLALETRKSFETYKKVVGDNGLFAAFPDGSAFGKCKGYDYGYAWWSFDESEFGYQGSKEEKEWSSIVTTVEEDEGGDSVDRAIERMREFNEKRYFGVLDDNFEAHVDYFWYGFKKLMELSNSMFEFDLSSFKAYCFQVETRLGDQAYAFGGQMDDKQLEEFGKQVEELSGGDKTKAE